MLVTNFKVSLLKMVMVLRTLKITFIIECIFQKGMKFYMMSLIKILKGLNPLKIATMLLHNG